MDTDGKPDHEGYEYQPAVMVLFVSNLFPLEYRPDYDCRAEERHGENIRLDGREPEGIGECECQGPDDARRQYLNCLTNDGSPSREMILRAIIVMIQNRKRMVKALANADMMLTITGMEEMEGASMVNNRPRIMKKGAPGG